VDLKDENIVEIVAFAADSWSRVISFNDRLYYTNSKRDEVVCCDINGTILWTFTDKSVLKDPRLTDNQHCIYKQMSFCWQQATA
jgi:hypothetical protein